MDSIGSSGSSGIPPKRPNRKKARTEERIKKHEEEELRAQKKRAKDRPRKQAQRVRRRAFQKKVEEERSKIHLGGGQSIPKEEHFAQLKQRGTEEAELLNRLKFESESKPEAEQKQSWVGWGLSWIASPITGPLRALGVISRPQTKELPDVAEASVGKLQTFMPQNKVRESSRPVLSEELEKMDEHRRDKNYSREHREEYEGRARERVHEHASKMEAKPGRGTNERTWIAALKAKQETGHDEFTAKQIRDMKNEYFSQSDRAGQLVKLKMEDIAEESETEEIEETTAPVTFPIHRTHQDCKTGFAFLDGTGFVNASLKAMLAAYPEEYFVMLRTNQFDDPAKEAVRQAFIRILDIAHGRAQGSENAVEEISALIAAMVACDKEEDGIAAFFGPDGSVTTQMAPGDFLLILMGELDLDQLASNAGGYSHYTVPDQEAWGSALPPCLASGIPTPGKENDVMQVGPPVVLRVIPGDGSQTVQGCLNQVFAPEPMEDGQSFYLTKKTLEKQGYREGQNSMLDYKLAALTDGDKRVAMPVKSKAQPRMIVDLKQFDSFTVSFNVFGDDRSQVVHPGEIDAITRRSGEYITVPVTDHETGLHYLVKMRQKSVCGFDESTGKYVSCVREGEKWRAHNNGKVSDKLKPSPWFVDGKPYTGQVMFYERVGEPIPVPSANIISLEQNQFDGRLFASYEHKVAEDVEVITGKPAKAFREKEDDILITDLTRPHSLTSGNKDYKLYNHLQAVRHNGKPLVGSEAEFIALFSDMPRDRRNNFQEMERQLTLFRRYQEVAAQPDSFPPATFAFLVQRGELIEGKCFEPLATEALRRQIIEGDFEANVESARGHVRDFAGVAILDRNLECAKNTGIDLVAPGIGNFGNTCFFNSPLVLLADRMHRNGVLEQVRHQEIPFSVARDMIQMVYPSEVYPDGATDDVKQAMSRERAANIERAARDALDGKEPYASRFFGFQDYYVFRDSFVRLMDAMHPDSDVRPIPPQLLKDFIQNYHRFSAVCNRGFAKTVFGDVKSDEIKIGDINQEDPTEVMGDICQLLGIHENPESAVIVSSMLQMVDENDRVLLQRPVGRAEYSPDIKMEIVGNAAPTLSGLCQNFMTNELLNKAESVNWSDEDLDLAGYPIEDREKLRTRKKVVLSCAGVPPKRLMISPKMFGFNFGEDKMKLQADGTLKKLSEDVPEFTAYKTVEEGNALIRRTDAGQYVRLPFTTFGDPSASLRGDQTVEEDYSIKSIICHSGHSPTGGHYIVVKFDKGRTIIYDDSAVFDLEQAHLFHYEQEPYKDWQDYLLRTGRQPYMFSLEASPPELGQPVLDQEEDQDGDDQELFEMARDMLTPVPDSPKDKSEPSTPLYSTPPGTPVVVDDHAAPRVEATEENVFVFPPVDTDQEDYDAPVITGRELEQAALALEEINPPEGAPAPLEVGPVTIVSGDICQLKTQWGIVPDAVVNAANERLVRGSGVCGAIFKAAGSGAKQLQDECLKFKGCPPGESRTTAAYDLDSQWVQNIIHTVGPDMRNKERYGSNPERAAKELKSAYQSALAEAQSRGMKKIAMPALSSGVFGFDGQRSVEIAAEAIREYHAKYPNAPKVVFVLYHGGSDSKETTQGEELRDHLEAALQTPSVSQAPVVQNMDVPPVESDHCVASSKHATDPVARMNYRLYEALNSVPLVEGASDRESWGSWAWRLMMTYDHYKLPERLVHRKSEFVRMFKTVPAEYRQKPEEMISAVRRFKALREKTPAITPGMFSYMLARGDLDSSKNINEIDTNIEQFRSDTDMPVVDPGMVSRSAVKFYPGFDSGHVDSSMQSSLHLMAGMFADEEQINHFGHQAIPEHVLRDLVRARLPDDQNAMLDQRVEDVRESRGDFGARKEEIEEPYLNFQSDFANLMHEMTNPVPGESLVYMYQSFLESFKNLCYATGRPVPAVLRARRDPSVVQPSPHELMQQMMDLLGMHSHPDYALKASEHFALGNAQGEKYKMGQTLQGASLPMPLPSKVGNPSLQSMVLDCAGETEMIDKTVAGVWSEEERRSNGISDRDLAQFKTRRSVTFECIGDKPPERLMFNIEAPTSGGFNGSALEQELSGLIPQQIDALMTNTVMEVPVGVPLQDSKGNTAVVNYRVQDVVCKRVDKDGKSHYLTVKFLNDKPYICDGAFTIRLEDYVTAGGRRPGHNGWMQFCAAENLRICSFTLRRDPVSRGLEDWHKDGNYESEVEFGRHEFAARLNDIHEQRRLAKLAERRRKQQEELAKAVVDPIQIDLKAPEAVERTRKPGLANKGLTCYAGSSLVCLMEVLSDQQLQGIEDRIEKLELEAEKNAARGFLNLARAYKAGASDEDIDDHLDDLYQACHFVGEARKEANRLKINDKVDRTELFAQFFKGAGRENGSTQDAAEFALEMMEILGLREDPSSSVAVSYDFVADVDGVELRKPEQADPQRTCIVQVPILSAKERDEEAKVGNYAAAMEKTPGQYLASQGFKTSEDYMAAKGMQPKTIPEKGIQEYIDGLDDAEEIPGVIWELEDYQKQERGNYQQVKARKPDIDQLFSLEDEDGVHYVQQTTTREIVYSGDVTKLESMMLQYKIFDNSNNKRVGRASALRPEFDKEVMIPVRHTDGVIYDVVLQPRGVSAHSGGLNVGGGHYIGFTNDSESGQWTRHDDASVTHQEHLKDMFAHPYLVHYKVVGKSPRT